MGPIYPSDSDTLKPRPAGGRPPIPAHAQTNRSGRAKRAEDQDVVIAAAAGARPQRGGQQAQPDASTRAREPRSASIGPCAKPIARSAHSWARASSAPQSPTPRSRERPVAFFLIG